METVRNNIDKFCLHTEDSYLEPIIDDEAGIVLCVFEENKSFCYTKTEIERLHESSNLFIYPDYRDVLNEYRRIFNTPTIPNRDMISLEQLCRPYDRVFKLPHKFIWCTDFLYNSMMGGTVCFYMYKKGIYDMINTTDNSMELNELVYSALPIPNQVFENAVTNSEDFTQVIKEYVNQSRRITPPEQKAEFIRDLISTLNFTEEEEEEDDERPLPEEYAIQYNEVETRDEVLDAITNMIVLPEIKREENEYEIINITNQILDQEFGHLISSGDYPVFSQGIIDRVISVVRCGRELTDSDIEME